MVKIELPYRVKKNNDVYIEAVEIGELLGEHEDMIINSFRNLSPQQTDFAKVGMEVLQKILKEVIPYIYIAGNQIRNDNPTMLDYPSLIYLLKEIIKYNYEENVIIREMVCDFCRKTQKLGINIDTYDITAPNYQEKISIDGKDFYIRCPDFINYYSTDISEKLSQYLITDEGILPIEYYKKLRVKYRDKLVEFVEKNRAKVDEKVIFSCQHCGNENQQLTPMLTLFFSKLVKLPLMM